MKLTIKDALIKGVEAHKKGNIREADQYYTAILSTLQPNQPDANHNMGVLGVNLGKIKDSIPFFSESIES